MTLVEGEHRLRATSFVSNLAVHGEAPALITADGPIAYAELDLRVEGIARRLGPVPRLVAINAAKSVDVIVAYLGALRGGHAVLLLPSVESDGANELLSAYDPDVVFSADGELRDRRSESTHELHPELSLLMPTSGTTGSSKLVRLSSTNLESNARAIAAYLGLRAEDRGVTSLPIHYCYGLSVLNSHLEVGAAVVLTDLSVVDRCFWELFATAGVTGLAGVPHTFELLDRAGFADMELPKLRYVTQAGGRMSPDRVREYASVGARRGWDLFVMYGQTEATARMAYLPPQMTFEHPEKIGVAIPGGALRIASPDASGVGELVYQGDNVMMGYAHGPDDLALGPQLTELRTGDLGWVDSAGLFEVVGRESRFVKPFGLRIDLDQVETRAAAAGFDTLVAGDDQGLVLGVLFGPPEEAARWASDFLGLPLRAVVAVSLAEFPRLSSGKPDYPALRAAARSLRPMPGPAPDMADVRDAASRVRLMFADILGVEPEADDTFVSLGGDSLSYVEMSLCLEEILGTLPPNWQNVPLEGLVPQEPRRSALARVDTSALLRAAAMVLIVGTHAGTWALAGGAHALFGVSGFNFGRFRAGPRGLVASVMRIAVPSVLWISALAVVSRDWGWPNAALVNGWIGPARDHWGYWYIEALVQTLLVLAAVTGLPGLRSAYRRHAFAVALGALVIGLVVRFDLFVQIETTRTTSRPHEIFWIFALGWAAGVATSRGQQLIVTAAAILAVPGFFTSPSRGGIVLGGLLLVTWIPTVPLPRSIVRPVSWIAGASLHIYLTHFQVYKPLLRSFGPGAAVLGSLLVGVAVWLAVRPLWGALEAATRRMRFNGRQSEAHRGPQLGGSSRDRRGFHRT
jgi:acyl-CoA synthetase (AMP-forming)/AMP-acid ligase II/peptidoglycan/LPS O-acetylase OafA/YrhL